MGGFIDGFIRIQIMNDKRKKMRMKILEEKYVRSCLQMCFSFLSRR